LLFMGGTEAASVRSERGVQAGTEHLSRGRKTGDDFRIGMGAVRFVDCPIVALDGFLQQA